KADFEKRHVRYPSMAARLVLVHRTASAGLGKSQLIMDKLVRTVSCSAGAHGTSATAVEPCTNRRTLIEWNALSDAEAERCCDRNVGEREGAHDELAITEAVLEHVEMP